jgi:hypothetical protein
MNERIREFAIQSGILDVADRKYMTDAEKFAELIVRECINIACEYDKPKLSGPGLAIALNIESHFDIYIEEDGRFVK